ncbi:30S ribosomal protein S18 [bacterium]|nr:30S ribosomal protein S18 [bacterium]
MPRKNTRSTTKEGGSRRARREMALPRECRICVDSVGIDYKQPDLLKNFMTERGKILPRRISGNCARHQRAISRAIGRARVMLLVR